MKKKSLLLFAAIGCLSLGMNAQLRVLSNGHVQVGNYDAQQLSFNEGSRSSAIGGSIGGGSPSIQLYCDSTTTLSILGNNQYNFSGGSIAFGGRKDVMIEERSFTPSSYTGLYGGLSLVGKGGIFYASNSGTIFSYTDDIYFKDDAGVSSTAFKFNVNLLSPKYLTSSDARYKKNVESLESMGGLLENLTPVSYNLDIAVPGEEGTAQKASAAKADERRSFGFIAQEVREIFPDLVFEDEEGMLSVDYNGFIPLLVDAYKNLKAKVSEQEEVIATLTGGAKKTRGTTAGIDDLYQGEKVVLMQNRPNPFKVSTEIKCQLPQGVSEAFICIYDLNGRQQMRLDIAERGDVSVSVSGNSLQPGMYIYTLITDGREADSKRMILTE